MNVSTSAVLQDLRRAPITGFQISCVAICVCLNMLDGFDVLVIAFAAPGIAAEWHLTGSQLAILLSAGFLGMAGGSLLLAPLADRFGRHPIVMASVALCSIGMILSALSVDRLELALLRGLTGLGIGTVLPTVSVLVSEYSPDRWRNSCITLYTAGYPIGAAFGGGIAGLLISHYSWRAAFVFGAFCSLALLPIAFRYLPESIEFLITKQPRDALTRINNLLTRLGHPSLSGLPPLINCDAAERAGKRGLLHGGNLRKLTLICVAFFMAMATLYFVNSWIPKLLSAQGMAVSRAITAGVLLNFGGIFGTLAIGLLCIRYDVRHLTKAFALIAAGSLCLFARPQSSYSIVLVIAALVGGSINGTIGGLYATAAALFRTDNRGTGMGWALGAGRIGAILSPLVVGALIDLRWSPPQLCLLFVIPVSLALISVVGLRSRDMLL